MDTTINEIRSPSKTLNGRNYQTFTPKSADDLIKIHHDDCFGTNKISNIQVEVGNEPTFFVTPTSQKYEVSGIFKDIRAINIQMQDPNSDLWSKIIANNKAMLIEYGSNEMQSAIGLSADMLRAEFQESQNRQNSSWTQTLEGFESRVKDEISESTVTQLADLYDVKIADVNGNVSELTQLVNGFKSRVENAEGQISTYTQTVNGFRQDVADLEGNYTQMGILVNGLKTTVNNELKGIKSTQAQFDDRITQVVTDVEGNYSSLDQRIDSLVSSISGVDGDFSELIQKIDAFGTRIGDVEGNQSSLTQRVNGIQSRVSTVEGNYSSVSQLVNGIQSEVFDYWGNSKITQLSNDIQSKVSASQVESIISQQSDNIFIGLRSRIEDVVEANQMTGSEIKTAINLSNDGIKLSGRNIAIDGNTYISNGIIKSAHIGDAQITDAKIGSVSADKMTTGTLNAALVNLINMNANNIVTGTMSADRIRTGIIQGPNFYINLNQGLMESLSDPDYYGRRKIANVYNSNLNFRIGSNTNSSTLYGRVTLSQFNNTGNYGIVLAHHGAGAAMIGYDTSGTDTGDYQPYIVFDKNQKSGTGDYSYYTIRAFQPMEFTEITRFTQNINAEAGIYFRNRDLNIRQLDKFSSTYGGEVIFAGKGTTGIAFTSTGYILRIVNGSITKTLNLNTI